MFSEQGVTKLVFVADERDCGVHAPAWFTGGKVDTFSHQAAPLVRSEAGKTGSGGERGPEQGQGASRTLERRTPTPQSGQGGRERPQW